MMHTRIRTRIISTLLSAAMCLSMFPAQAFAATVEAKLQVEAETQSPIVVLDGDAETAEGAKLTLRVTEGQHIARDYDQTLYVQVTNHSAVMQKYYLSCNNNHADLSMNFVMAGAEESPLVIEPGETQTVELSVFAQNAEDTVYTVSVQSTLVTTGKEVEDASIDLPFTCDPGDGQVSIEPQGAADPSTLVQTYKITNTGGSDIADLGLTLAGEDTNYLRLDPLVENYPLAAGESITVELVPDLAQMKADNKEELTGTIVPTGGVAPTVARAASSFVVKADLEQVKTISASDLALYQEGNPYYNSEYAWEKTKLTSTVGETTTDLVELSQKYYNSDDTSGVNTSDELDEVLDKLIAEDGTYDLAIQTVLQYTDEDGTQKEVGINVSSKTEIISSENASASTEPGFTYYYFEGTDTLRVEMVTYSTDVQGYNDQIAAGINAAKSAVYVSQPDTALLARTARAAEGIVKETCAVEFSKAGLDILGDIASNDGHVDFTSVVPEEALDKIKNLCKATAPVRTMANVLEGAASVSELVVDIGETADVWNDPDIPAADKVGYTAVITMKHTFGNVLNTAIVTTSAGVGGLFLDGVGMVLGAALGSVAAGYISDLIEEDLELYKQLFAQMRFQSFGSQCTNRGLLSSTFKMPAYTSSDGSDALSGALEVPSIYVSSRLYDGRPYRDYYADEEFGGDEYEHHREGVTNYKLNGQTLKTQVEHGLSEAAFAELKGEAVAEALKDGAQNTLVRDYATNAGHYLVETDMNITVMPEADFELGYVDSPDELQDVRQLPDFAVFPENIGPEKAFILDTANKVGVSVSNLGSAGGWVNVTAACNGEPLGTHENVYVAPFSSEKVFFTCTPTQEENTITVTLDRPETSEDGFQLSTEETLLTNNEASEVLYARERMVPKIVSMPELVRFEEIPQYVVELEDALDVASVKVEVNGRTYAASLQQLSGDYGGNMLRAVAALDGQNVGTYQATVTVEYYAAENGQTVTKKLTQSAEVIFQQDEQIIFYLDCPSACIDATRFTVLQRNSAGELEIASNATIGLGMQSNPSRFTVEYGLRTPDEQKNCYVVIQYNEDSASGTPGGIAVASLDGLAGRTLPTSGEEVVTASITAAVNKLNLSKLTAINGMPLASSVPSSRVPEVKSYDGKIYFSGADSIQMQASVDPGGNDWFYTRITLSKDSPDVNLTDFYTEVELGFDYSTLSSAGVMRDAYARLIDADGTPHIVNAYAHASTSSANVYLPVQLDAYTDAYAAIFHRGSRGIVYLYADLKNTKEQLSRDTCKQVTFQLPDGESPLDCQLSITRQDIGRAQTVENISELDSIYLAPGVYDVELDYQAEADGTLYTYQDQLNITDTAETMVISLPGSSAGLARRATPESVFALEVNWPAIFTGAELYTRTSSGWGEQPVAVQNGGTTALPPGTNQVRLALTSAGCMAEVVSGVPENGVLQIGDTFTGTAAAKTQTCTPGGTLTLRLSDLSSGSAYLKGYQASAEGAELAGTVTLRGSETYTLPVTVSDLSEELNVTLPQEITGGSYECAVSLLTEQTVEPPNDPDIPDIPEDPDDPDNPDTPDEPDTPSGGGGGGSAADGKPDVEVSGTGGTAAAANNGTVTITPDEGYKISTITVNGKEIAVPSDGKLTGLNRNDRVVITFEKADTEGLPVISTFTDVAADAWYADAVQWAVEHGITGGTSATTFSPDTSCTRAQMVTFLWRAAGSPEPIKSSTPFADVDATAYYYEAMLWAVEQNITSGTSATTFSPDAVVTRSQTVTFLWRDAGSPPTASGSSFMDVTADAYYAEAVTWAASEDITSGTSAITFSPDADCTRAQIVTFLWRYCVG